MAKFFSSAVNAVRNNVEIALMGGMAAISVSLVVGIAVTAVVIEPTVPSLEVTEIAE